MQRAVIHATGGPEVIEFADLGPLEPAAGQVLLRHTAIGLNFIDTYHRSGLYPLPLPSGLGLEAAGVVEAVGEGVVLTPGTRVGYFRGPIGAYSTHRLIAADQLLVLPHGVSDAVAAAAMLKGCTAEFLVERCAKVEPGQWVLVTAAAGGVGQLLVQWLKHIGAHVIASAGSAEKLAIAKAHGADHGLVLDDQLASKVREITGGRGVDAVLDGVGKATFDAALDSLKRRGLLVSFGNASGPVGAVDFGILARKGSLFATRATLFDYYLTREDVEKFGGKVLGMISKGILKVNVDQQYALSDAAQAHRDLEGRRTTGSTVLVP